jgi:predicted restriction endonuclease
LKEFNSQDKEFIHLLEEIYPSKIIGGLVYEDKSLYDRIYKFSKDINMEIERYFEFLGFKVLKKGSVIPKTETELLKQVKKLFPDNNIVDIQELMKKSNRIYLDVCKMGARNCLTPTGYLYSEGFRIEKFEQKEVLYDFDSFHRLKNEYDINVSTLASLFNLSDSDFISFINNNGKACPHWRGHVITREEEDVIEELIEKETTYFHKKNIHAYVYRSKDENTFALLIKHGLKVQCYFEDLPPYYQRALKRKGYQKYAEEDFVLKRELWSKWTKVTTENREAIIAKGYILDGNLIYRLFKRMEEYNKNIPNRFRDENDFASFLHFDNSIEWIEEDLDEINYIGEIGNNYKGNEEVSVEQRLSVIRKIQGSLEKEIISLNRVQRSQKLSEHLKRLYNYRCQLCSPTEEGISSSRIMLENGKEYVEVHHILPISEATKRIYEDETNLDVDSYKNIVVVCPNHHKMLHFHYGGFLRLIKDQGELFFVSEKDHRLKVERDYHLKENFVSDF